MYPPQVFDCSCVFVEIPGKKKQKKKTISKSEVEVSCYVSQLNYPKVLKGKKKTFNSTAHVRTSFPVLV